jgi:hypothetical protein
MFKIYPIKKFASTEDIDDFSGGSQHGKTLTYGSPIRLMHIKNEKYLTVSMGVENSYEAYFNARGDKGGDNIIIPT